jgi:hypothetical protein
VCAALWKAVVLSLWLGVSAPPQRPQGKTPGGREVVVLASAAGEANEPAFLFLCAGADGKFREGPACRPPLPGSKARRPKEGEHTVGRVTSASPCELSRLRRMAVVLEPAAPRGPFLAIAPAIESTLLTPAEELPTRVPDPALLETLGAAVQGTPVIDQSLVVDLNHDDKEDRLIAVRKAGGGAQLILIPGDAPTTWRALPIAAGARAVQVLAVGDLNRDRQDELFVFVQLEGGWEIRALASNQDAPLATLRCSP